MNHHFVPSHLQTYKIWEYDFHEEIDYGLLFSNAITCAGKRAFLFLELQVQPFVLRNAQSEQLLQQRFSLDCTIQKEIIYQSSGVQQRFICADVSTCTSGNVFKLMQTIPFNSFCLFSDEADCLFDRIPYAFDYLESGFLFFQEKPTNLLVPGVRCIYAICGNDGYGFKILGVCNRSDTLVSQISKPDISADIP